MLCSNIQTSKTKPFRNWNSNDVVYRLQAEASRLLKASTCRELTLLIISDDKRCEIGEDSKKRATIYCRGEMRARTLSLLLLLALLVCPTEAVSRHYNVSEAAWDAQFSKGTWDYLGKVAIERARNSVISGVFALSYAANGRVLDVGCGEGVLSDYLTEKQRKQYLGIDVSKEAIKIANQRREGLNFLQTDALTFVPPDGVTYDVIIFNEMLYYTDHKDVLKKYSTNQFLSKNGIIVISVWYSSKDDHLRSSIYADARKMFESIDTIIISGATKRPAKGTADVMFHVEAFRPRH